MARVHEANNFDAFRIAAALMVVAGHAYVLSGRAEAEPMAAHLAFSFGDLGVSIFFVISGFLVTMSFERVGRLSSYLANRALRILPGLAVALVLTALVLGPLVSRLPAAAYYASPRTWTYVARNLALYPVTYRLPGVFDATPYPQAVNGSLWTLRLEFTLYLALPLLAAVRLTSRRGLALVAAGAGAACLAVSLLGAHVPGIVLVGARDSWLFLAGAALYAWRDARGLFGRPVLAAAAAVVLMAVPLGLFAVAFVLVLPVLVVGLALRPAPGLRAAARFGDLSYGLYIYAFPVQQTLMQALGPARLSVPAFFLLSLACTAPLAAFSWWCVERPALSLKRRSAASGGPAALAAQAGSSPGSPPPPGGAGAQALPQA